MTDGRPTAPLVTLDDIRAAAERLRGVAIRTPLVAFGPPGGTAVPQGRVAPADRRVQAPRRVRDDRLAVAPRSSPAASSPTRRATTPRASRGRPACSGVPAVVVMPSDAPAVKRERVEADGAEVVIVGTASDERQQVAEEIAAERGLAIIPPYDDDRIIAGPGHGRPRDRRGPAGPRGGPRADRRRRAGERRRRRDPGAATGRAGHRRRTGAGGRRARFAGARRDRRAGRPSSSRGRSPTGRGRRRSASGRSRICARCLDSIVTVSEAEIAAGRPAGRRAEPARRRAVGRARRSRRWRSTPASSASIGLDGPVVAVVSGGNVDPERYRELPRGADPAAGLSGRRDGRRRCPTRRVSPRSSARRSASRRSRIRIWAISTSARRSARGLVPRLGPHPARDDGQDRGQEDQRRRASHMIPAASRWSSSAGNPHGRTSVA